MIISKEQFSTAYNKLPFPIREFLASDDLTTVTQSIGTTYKLHIDTMGALKRETTNMLLGLINPTQFVGELKSVGIPQASIGAIVEELNAKVFMPLREKMKNPPEEDSSDNESEIEATSHEHTPTPVAYVAPAVVTSTVRYVEPPMPATIQAPAPAHITPVVVAAAPVVQPIPQPVIARTVAAPVIQPVPHVVSPVIQPTPLSQSVAQPTPHITQPVAQAAPVTPPAPAYTIPTQPARPSVSEFSIPSAAVSAATTTFSMSPASFSSSIPRPVTPPENIVAPHARTMQEDMRMVQEHPGQTAPTQQPQTQQQFQPQAFSAQPQPLVTPTRPPAYAQAPVRPLAPSQAPNAFASPASPLTFHSKLFYASRTSHNPTSPCSTKRKSRCTACGIERIRC